MIVLTKEIESGVQKEMSRRDFLSSAAWAIAGATMLGSEVFGRQTAAPILKPIDDLKITHGQSPAVPAHNYEFANGNWFDGKKFVLRTFYSVGGILSNRKPPRVDQVIDLRGKFIVPPFGEAHNHNLDWSSDEQFARLRRKYLEHGIFYVKNPTNLPRTRESLLGKINIPTNIDGSFSNGGLTATGGHPIEIVTPKRGFKPTDGE